MQLGMKLSDAIERMVDLQIVLSREGPDELGFYERQFFRDQFDEAKAIVDAMYEAGLTRQAVVPRTNAHSGGGHVRTPECPCGCSRGWESSEG